MLCKDGGRYLAYMLRLWQVQGEGGAVWRATLEDARTGERRGFASLEAFVAWLREETDALSMALHRPRELRKRGG
jgi:hypothetical protein